MRLDHLLSKEESVSRGCFTVELSKRERADAHKGEAGSLLTEVSGREQMHESFDSREKKRSGIERVERRTRAERITE